MKKSLDSLGEVQKAVIEIVWEMGEASVHEVLERLDRKKKPAYTTILTVMQVLERKGWLTHRTEGRGVYKYIPTVTRNEADAQTVRHFIKHLFKGDSKVLFQHLLDESELSEADLAEFKKMIEQRRKEGKATKDE